MTTYTDEQKAEAVQLYLDHGAAEAARRVGCDPRTIRRWAKAADVSADRDLVLEQGGERLARQNEYNRQQIRDELLTKSLTLLQRIDAPHKEFKAAGSIMHELVHDHATSGDARNYASAVKDLMNLFRLEMGEATNRSEVHSDLDREIQTRIGEWERQLAAND